MPRIARQIEDGGYYHILTRGNDRKRIFRCGQDFLYFIRLAGETRERHQLFIYHYCLMNNHMHFLVKALDSKALPKFFQILFQRYASYFRKRYHHTGYLFQNRYKSYHIDKESYLLECARYIERNPLRANIVGDPADYQWSSFLYYANGEKNAIISEPNPLYMNLSPIEEDRQKRYKDYILEDRVYEHIVDKGFKIQ